MKMTTQFTKTQISTLLLLICVGLLFSGCTNEVPTSTDYVTTLDGQDIIIHFPAGTKSEGTISSEKGVYSFSYSSDGTFSVIYPSGDNYSQSNINGGIVVSPGFDFDKIIGLGYIDGISLERAVQEASKSGSSNVKAVSPIISIFIVVVGVWFTWKPKSVWWFARGRMFKNVEPSDFALGRYRGVGAVVVIIGVISFFA